MRTLQSIAVALLLASTCHAEETTVNAYAWDEFYAGALERFYGEGIVRIDPIHVPRYDVPQLMTALDAGKLTVSQFVSILQGRGVTMPEISKMLRGYGLAVDNVAVEYVDAPKMQKLAARWGFSLEIANCLAAPTSPLSTATAPAFFVAAKDGSPRFLEVYEKDVDTIEKMLKSAPLGSVILALDYQWKSIETIQALVKYADRLHSVILLWGVHNAIDQTDFTEAGEVYNQLYRIVKCINPAIFVWKQVCLVTGEDGIFKWLEAVDGPCDGFAVWGPYMLPEQVFATSSIKRWREALGKDKPIALGSLFYTLQSGGWATTSTGKEVGYAQKAGYSGIIKQGDWK